MSFSIHKSWGNRRVLGRQITWLVHEDGKIKLKLEEGEVYREVIVAYRAAAQVIWDRFKAGESIYDCVSVLAEDVRSGQASKRAGHER